MWYALVVKPHPKIRKTVKWGGAVVTVLLVVVWIGSWWFDAEWGGEAGPWVRVVRGGLMVGLDETNPPYHTGWRTGSARFVHGDTWWFHTVQQGSDYSLHMPLWLFAGAAGVITVVAWRLDTLARRRARLNLCPKCGYDWAGLRGGAGAVCPECGSRETSQISN